MPHDVRTHTQRQTERRTAGTNTDQYQARRRTANIKQLIGRRLIQSTCSVMIQYIISCCSRRCFAVVLQYKCINRPLFAFHKHSEQVTNVQVGRFSSSFWQKKQVAFHLRCQNLLRHGEMYIVQLLGQGRTNNYVLAQLAASRSCNHDNNHTASITHEHPQHRPISCCTAFRSAQNGLQRIFAASAKLRIWFRATRTTQCETSDYSNASQRQHRCCYLQITLSMSAAPTRM